MGNRWCCVVKEIKCVMNGWWDASLNNTLKLFSYVLLYLTYDHNAEFVKVIRVSSFFSRVFKDRAHLSTFQIFIFEIFSCFIVLVVLLVIVQSSELISVWFCEKMTFFANFFSYHIFAIYVGGASSGLPTGCRLIAVSGARLPSVDGLVVRCIKMHHHVKSAITICLQFIYNMFTIYTCMPTHRGSVPVFYLQKAPSWGIYVNWINFNPSVDK